MNGSHFRSAWPLSRFVAQALDFLIIWAGGQGAYLLLAKLGRQAGAPANYGSVMLAASLSLLVLSPLIYRAWRGERLRMMLRAGAGAWAVVVMSALVYLFLTKTSAETSRLWLIVWAGLTLLLFGMQRVAIHGALRWLQVRGLNLRSLVLVGAGPLVEAVRQAVLQSPWCGVKIVAEVPPADLESYLQTYKRRRDVEEVWLCVPMADQEGIRTALDALRFSTADIRLVPDLFSMSLINHGVSEVAGIAMLDLSASPITGGARVLKQLEDYLVASVVLMVVAVPMVLISIAIKATSKGPVLYKQLRHGWNGEEIVVWKFRSMVMHDEGEGTVTQARKADARITPLGAFLRRTSLDELPQFLNVLQGRMSVVGPRPHALAHNEHYKELVPGYMLRHKVKPGVTGWAQINGYRGETDTLEKMMKRVEYDLYYINNWSLTLDAQIILRTFFKGFVHRNAY